jgi:hypothetical protein
LPLKIHHPQLGLNLQTSSSVTSTLSSRPLRTCFNFQESWAVLLTGWAAVRFSESTLWSCFSNF